jgi:hypothetical protein
MSLPLPASPPGRAAARAAAALLALALAGCGGGGEGAAGSAAGPQGEATADGRARALAATAGEAVPVQRWSDPATWGGVVPPTGAAVVVPAGRTVVLDGPTAALRSLVIEGTLLADPSRDVAITADAVLVRGGRLSIGTAAQPHLPRATITLTGSGTADLPGMPGFGAKVLGQMGGTIELHGRPVVRSWTRLDGGDVAAGSREITLAEDVGWRPGDQIVVSSSSPDQHHYSLAEIAAIDGRRLTLREGLRFAHHGAVRQVGTRQVDTRAAVGLLSRNVVVRGDANSAALKIGGHAMFMASAQMPATVQLTGVAFTAMGQHNVSGRYPLHFHVMGPHCRACYVRDVTVHRTIQRGIVLHDTSGVTVQGNVVFDTVGHNVFVETAQTRGNVIDRNLALVNRQPSPLHTDPTLVSQNDRLPSNFWFRTGANAVTNNVAAGSQASGFNYDGIDAAPIDFRGNTASAAMGLSGAGEGDFDIFGGLLIASEAVRPAGDRIQDVTVFHNAFGLWPEETGTTRIERFVAAANGINLFGRGVGNAIHFKDGLVVGRLPGAGAGPAPGPALHYTYGSDTWLENVTFAGYASLNMSAGETDPTQSSVRLSGIGFIGTPPALDLGDLLRYEALDDTMLPRGYYVTRHAPWMVLGGECMASVLNPADPDDSAFFRCPRAYPLTELDVRRGGSGGYSARINPWLLRSDGLRYRRATGDAGMGSGVHGTTVLHGVGASYRLDEPPTVAATALRLIDDGNPNEDGVVVAETARLFVAVPYAAVPRAVHRTGSRFQRPDAPSAATLLRPVASWADLEANPAGTYLYDPATRQLWVQASRRWLVVLP